MEWKDTKSIFSIPRIIILRSYFKWKMVVKLLASKHTAFAFNDSISPLENERNNKPLNKVDNAEVPRILVPGAIGANTHFFGGESITIFSMLFLYSI